MRDLRRFAPAHAPTLRHILTIAKLLLLVQKKWSTQKKKGERQTTNGKLRRSQLLGLRRQHPPNHLCHPIPLLLFALQSPFAFRREPVVLRLPFVFRFAPLARNPALVLQPVQRRIERPLLNLEPPARNLLNPEQHSI